MTGYTPTQADVRNSLAARTGESGFQDVMLTRSPDSAAMLPYWDLTDTLVDGIDAVRLAGEAYLPRFLGEHRDEYEFRLKLTKMTNIYRDTVEGLASKPFEQEVTLPTDENKTVPEPVLQFAENVDGSGNNLTMFASATFFNGINSAVDWIMVDYPKANAQIRNEADRKASGTRPYWSHVLARNVYEPRSEMINGDETLTYLKIYEPGKPDRIRIFERLPNGTVTWTLYEKGDKPIKRDDGETYFVVVDGGTIAIGVIPLVPFITGRRDGRSWRFFPAMRDAADLQIDLYQQESGLKFIKNLAAYPMLAGNGIKPMMEPDGVTVKKLAVGPGRVLYGGRDGNGNTGSWEYVEPAATSMTFLASDVTSTMAQLRELGRQPLIVGNITVITAARGAAKAKSAVKAWAYGLKDTLENAMVITCKWLQIKTDTYDPVVSVYVEFDEFVEGKDFDTLDADRDRKDISRLTLWEEKQRRGVYGPEFTAEREEKRLLEELPGDGEDMQNIDELTGAPILPSDPRYKPPGVTQ